MSEAMRRAMFSASIWNALPSTINRPTLDNDPFWGAYVQVRSNVSIHVAILSQPYLELVLTLQKTVESRFSADKRSPYKRVSEGDVILLKQVGGPICGIAYASKVWCYKINPQIFASIRLNFGKRLQIHDPVVWERYKRASYATLIALEHVRRIEPISYSKRDQRAWITFSHESTQLPLPLNEPHS
jgi:hypothetical protein